jgi:hypothetical protein
VNFNTLVSNLYSNTLFKAALQMTLQGSEILQRHFVAVEFSSLLFAPNVYCYNLGSFHIWYFSHSPQSSKFIYTMFYSKGYIQASLMLSESQ